MNFLQTLFGGGAGANAATGLVTMQLKPLTTQQELAEQQKTYRYMVVGILMFALLFFAVLIWGFK